MDTFNDLTKAAQQYEHLKPHQPLYLTIHHTQHGQALLAVIQAAHHGHHITIHHYDDHHYDDHQPTPTWYLSEQPLKGTHPAPDYDPDDE